MLSFQLPIIKQDIWHGFRRYILDFEGRNGWVVLPEKEMPGRPWSWCLEWPDAFTNRTGMEALLAAGYHHVHLQAKGWGCDEDIAAFARFQDYLVNTLHFAEKANLIGMSFGGLYSLRYATAHPDRIRKIYLDAPVCNFKDFPYLQHVVEPYHLTDDYVPMEDPHMPINNAEKLTEIPMLLIYGKEDTTVIPALNCELFVSRFRDAGGRIHIIARDYWGHHPHGLDNPEEILKFFLAD